MEVLVKATVKGAVPDVGVAVKLAVTPVGAALTVIT
jgi:hypothetical protein